MSEDKGIETTIERPRMVPEMGVGVGVMVFNATFNNLSVISWWLVLIVEEIRVPGENHRPAASY